MTTAEETEIKRLEAENERLKAYIEALHKQWIGARYQHPETGKMVPALEQMRDDSRMLALCEEDRTEMANKIVRLRAALKPFAASFQIGTGCNRDDFQRASEAYGKITVNQQASEP